MFWGGRKWNTPSKIRDGLPDTRCETKQKLLADNRGVPLRRFLGEGVSDWEGGKLSALMKRG